VYLTDYYAIGSEKLFANILLSDASQSQLDVRFRITITGNNINLSTSPNYIPAPVTIHGGVPLKVSNSEFIEYLKPQNLIIEGSGAQEFLSKGKLQEGYYQFSLEVMEYYRNVKISNKAIAFAWIVTNEPPQWIFPTNNTKLTATEPQNIMFSWMPMHTASPNAAFTTNYKFKLVEMQADTDPNIILATTNPLYTEELSQNVLIYGPDKPTLEPGKFYVAQLKAFDTEGRDLFKNSGYSEPLIFKYGETCKTPLMVQHSNVTKITASFSWMTNQNNSSYVLQLRENGNDLSEWYDYSSEETSLQVKNLVPETTYEYRLKALCGNAGSNISSEYTTLKDFSTLRSGNANYNCNEEVELPELSSTDKILTLQLGTKIQVGGFYADIIQIDKAENGVFSGICETTLDIWGVKIYCTFTDITLNAQHQLITGLVKAIRTDHINWAGGDNPNGNGSGGGDPNTGGSGGGDTTVVIIVNDTLVTTTVPVDTVFTGGGNTVIITGGSDTTIVSGDTNITITTPGGGEIIVSGGQVTVNPPGGGEDPGGGNGGNPPGGGEPEEEQQQKRILVNFAANTEMQQYGYDKRKKTIPAFDPQYEQMLVHQQSYFVDWKSIESFNFDPVSSHIRLQDSLSKLSDVHFRNLIGEIPAMVGENDTTFSISLNGTSHQDIQYLEAYYTVSDTSGNEQEIIAGKLNIISYDEVPVNVCLVSVDGTNYPFSTTQLQYKLNCIFGQAVANISLSTYSLNIGNWNDNGTEGLSDEASGALSNYNDEMQNIKRAMRWSGDYDSNTYYLFMVPKSENESKTGYMPLKRQYGFIFTQATGNNTEEKLVRTIAHELSHGAFRLRHTFSSENLYQASQGITQNLMDYNTQSTNLRKFQWDYVHDPESMIGIFEDDDEGDGSWFNSKLSSVYFGDTIIENNASLFLLKDKTKKVVLKATQDNEGTEEDIEVNWIYENDFTEQTNTIEFLVTAEYFGSDSTVSVQVTDKVYMGEDSTQVFDFILLNVDLENEIRTTLGDLLQIEDRMKIIRQELDSIIISQNTLRSLYFGPNDLYIKKEMSKYYKISDRNPSEDPINSRLEKLFRLDKFLLNYSTQSLQKVHSIIEADTDGNYQVIDQEFIGIINDLLSINNDISIKQDLENYYKQNIKKLVIDEILKVEANE